MFTELISWPEKLTQGNTLADQFLKEYAHQFSSPINNLAFIGMGGSGIAGRLIKTILDKKSKTQSSIIDGPELPGFLDKPTLAIVVSYSGNTWETVSALQDALKKKLPVLIICHGGTLLELAKTHNLPVALLPECVAPRAAVGYILGFLIRFLTAIQALPQNQLIESFKELLHKKLPELSNESTYSDFLSLAKSKEFFHLWGISGDSAAVTYRAQTQFNENSKIQAVFSAFPELNHNLMVGLTHCQTPPLVLLFASQFLSKELSASVTAASKILHSLGVTLYKTPLFGDTWETQLFMMIVWADFASYYLGKARAVNIVSTAIIDQLKAQYSQCLQTAQ